MELSKITSYFNNLYPENLKASYDNVGLMVGDYSKDVKRVMVCLDLTLDIVNQAIDKDIDLIITHHPLFFHPVKSIDLSKDPGNIIYGLIKNEISVYSMHTNFDSAKMNDFLSSLLNFKNKDILSKYENIGAYGDIDETPFIDFINTVKNAFEIESCDYYGKELKTVKRVAIVGGSGSSLMDECLGKDIDVFITGDVSYSRGLEAIKKGINILDCGHHIENLFYKVILNDLKELDSNIESFKAIEHFPIYKRY